MNIVKINGKKCGSSCKGIVVCGWRILLDNKDVTPEDSDVIDIFVDGPIKYVQVDACNKIRVAGDVCIVRTESGSNGVVISNQNETVLRGQRIVVYGEEIVLDTKKITIIVNGAVDYVRADFCDMINVKGEVTKILTYSGNFEVTSNCNGSVSTESSGVKCYQ